MIAIPNMEKPKHCGMCEFQDMCACILLREPISYDINVLPDCPLIDIVTCGECEYYEESEYIEGDMACKYHIGHTYYTEADRFCSYGERRSE